MLLGDCVNALEDLKWPDVSMQLFPSLRAVLKEGSSAGTWILSIMTMMTVLSPNDVNCQVQLWCGVGSGNS